MNKKRIVLAVSLAAVAVLLAKGKSLLDERQAQIKEQPAPSTDTLWISTVKGSKGVLKQKRSVLAQIVSDKSIAVSTKLPGYVETVTVREAQKVKKGDLLVRIDSFELRSNIDALQKTLTAQQSDLALAQSIYERNKKLVDIGGISRETFTASKVAMDMKGSAVESTRQKITQLRHQLSYLEIKAPFDGVIDRVLLHRGDLAVTGKPVLTMHDKKQKLLFSYAPAADTPVKKGQEVLYDNRVIGHVRSIYPSARNGLSEAEAALNEVLALPAGSFINANVLTRKAEGCILPDTTIVHKKDADYVMVYRNGRFTPKKVEVLLHGKNRVLLEACPASPVASASESKLSALPAYDNVAVVGVKHEH